VKSDDDLPDPAEASAEEQARADEQRRAVDDKSDAVVALLAAAVSPRDLDDEAHDRILAQALGAEALLPAVVEEAPADAAEIKAADGLRRALDGSPADRAEHPLASLAGALRAAHAPGSIAEIRNEALLRPALRGRAGGGPRVLYGAVAGALALAAGIAGLWISGASDGPDTPAASLDGMVEVRSTAPLFSVEDFPQGMGPDRKDTTSERIDKITSARSADLRNNRYRAWGLD